MKHLAILLMALGIICNSFVIVAAGDDVQKVEMTAAEVGSIEDITHPFLFGQRGCWEISIDEFESATGEFMQISSSQLSDMIRQGMVRCSVEMDDGKWRLSTSPSVGIADGAAVFHLKANHSYGTRSQDMVLRIRIRVVRNIYWDQLIREFTTTQYIKGVGGRENVLVLEKGDILETTDMLFSAHYNSLSQYAPFTRISKEDVENGNVLADGEELYMATNRDKMISIDFGGAATYTTCISAAQKAVNLYYTLDKIDKVEKSYPDVAFSYITFNGEPSFINSGELSFGAIGGENTVVYSYSENKLDLMPSVYDEAAKTVTVRGVKRLGTYVIASEMLQETIEKTNDTEEHIRVLTVSNSNVS